MTIPTRMSLHGFIATAPEFNVENGQRQFFARIGVEHYKQVGPTDWERLEPTFHNLVVYGKTAEHAYARFKVGDSFVAAGHINQYEVIHDGRTRMREEFEANRIGHDVARSRYTVDRRPALQPEAPPAELSVVGPGPAVGL